MIFEMVGGDEKRAGDMLAAFTTFTGKDGNVVQGKRSVKDMTDKHAKAILPKVREEYKKFLAEQGGEAGDEVAE